jgi:hypothetical protein
MVVRGGSRSTGGVSGWPPGETRKGEGLSLRFVRVFRGSVPHVVVRPVVAGP